MEEFTNEENAGALFLKLFDGNQDRHIRVVPNGTRNDKGKTGANYKKVDGPITPAMAWDHLQAKQSYGLSPVKSDSTCAYGVLDFDIYNMAEDDVIEAARRMRCPSVAFRTKSKGLHIVVFPTEPVSAKQMHDFLVAKRRNMPKAWHKDIEVFPKASQKIIGPDDDPTSVNLPMRGQQRPIAWYIDESGAKHSWDHEDALSLIIHFDENCRIDKQLLIDMASAEPDIDASDIGYRVPDDPAGRDDLLMRIARSMQARGWTDSDMKSELYRLNNEAEKFHELFAKRKGDKDSGPLKNADIERIWNGAIKLEKGSPAQTNYRVVEKFNRDWAVIDIDGKIEYVRKSADHFVTYSKHDMLDKTAMHTIRMGKFTVPIAKLWLADIDRDEFEGVVCEPDDYGGRGYNVFRGFRVSPLAGDVAPFTDYIENVLCNGDTALAHWVTMWLADAMQRPTEPSTPTAIALRGPQGAGKSFLQEQILARILDPRSMHVVTESKRLFSQFNRDLFGCTFIACEESIFHGSKQDADALKNLITSKEWTYEQKHKAPFRGKNVHRLIATTNNKQAVHVERDDRRWTIIEVKQPYDLMTDDGKSQAFTFWKPYYDFVKSDGGPSAILHYLLHFPVVHETLTFPYGTDAKSEDKLRSDPVLAVLHQIAEDGVVPDDTKGCGIISIKTLTREVQKRPGGRYMSPEDVYGRVDDLVPFARSVRSAFHVTDVHKAQTQDAGFVVRALGESRQRGRDLGPLDQFRGHISTLTAGDYGEDAEWRPWEPPDEALSPY